jgi:predicted nucleic acid-binding protein
MKLAGGFTHLRGETARINKIIENAGVNRSNRKRGSKSQSIDSQLLLDTNAVSDFAESEQAIMNLLAGVQRLAVPVIVAGEYRSGLAHAREYHRWLGRLITESAALHLTDKTTHHDASIRAQLRQTKKTMPMNDAGIAARGRPHDLPILSGDQHFDVVPKRLTS